MDYNTLALLTYQMKKQEDATKLAELEKQLTDLMEECAKSDESMLYEMYEANAAFASKMGTVVQQAATELYSKGILEKDMAVMQQMVGRSFSIVADSVLWDQIATEFYSLLEDFEEDECEGEEEAE